MQIRGSTTKTAGLYFVFVGFRLEVMGMVWLWVVFNCTFQFAPQKARSLEWREALDILDRIQDLHHTGEQNQAHVVLPLAQLPSSSQNCPTPLVSS